MAGVIIVVIIIALVITGFNSDDAKALINKHFVRIAIIAIIILAIIGMMMG